MGTISAAAFRRIYVLYLIGQYPRGSYGAKRLQKMAYLPERESTLKPFTFKRHHYGQYSDELDDIKDQLMTMGYVAALPLDTATVTEFTIGEQTHQVVEGGNRFFLRDRSRLFQFAKALRAADPQLPGLIAATIKEFGFKPESEIIEYCYSLPEFRDKAMDDVVLGSNVGDRVELDLSSDECDDLELSMTPAFVVAMADIAKAVTAATIDLDRIEKLDHLPVPRP